MTVDRACTYEQPVDFENPQPFPQNIRGGDKYCPHSWATPGTLSGGTRMAVTEGDPANPTTLPTKLQREAATTSSYDEEEAAIRMALECLLPSQAAAAIGTDRQSLL